MYRLELSDIDGRPREIQKVELSHESGLALLFVDGPDLDGWLQERQPSLEERL